METKQLNGYKIEFYSEEEFIKNIACRTFNHNLPIPLDENEICAGKVSGISEELAEKIVDKNKYGSYKWYNPPALCPSIILTAKQSFKTLSNLPYCVIIKIE